VFATELLYYFGPNLKQPFVATLPGALVAVCGFFLGSAVLDFYFEHFANYNKTYGSLGAVIILMLWFYVIGLFILMGAEINAEMAKRRKKLAEGRPVTTLERAMPGAPAA
jgi:membrane protein